MISDEIQRIINAKAAIKTAIVGKGGTVSEDALIDDYAEAVETIPSGGGDLPVIHDDDPLTFVCALDLPIEQNISIEKLIESPSKSFEYNKNDTEWLPYVEGTIIPMKYGDLVRFRSNDTNAFSYSSYYRYFVTTGFYYCGGNIMSLMNNTNTLSGKDYCFYSCFKSCNILTPPVLPATTLAFGCYHSMFSGCTSLVTAPELPATTLATRCYESMFSGCTSLVTAPELPATTLVNYCYNSMFNGCTSLVTAPELPATTLVSNCYYSMFSGCTSLVTAPELPATTLAISCYGYMFYDCSGLVTAPELPATTLAISCYNSMFYGCTSLKTIKCNARYSSGTTEITSLIGSNWLGSVPNKSDCIFYKNPDWSGPTSRGTDTIPSNWQIVDWIK